MRVLLKKTECSLYTSFPNYNYKLSLLKSPRSRPFRKQWTRENGELESPREKSKDSSAQTVGEGVSPVTFVFVDFLGNSNSQIQQVRLESKAAVAQLCLNCFACFSLMSLDVSGFPTFATSSVESHVADQKFGEVTV